MCKSESQIVIDRDWLYEKYVTEKLSTYQIGKLVERNPRRVYDWLVLHKIPIRKRSWKFGDTKPYYDPEWLKIEYIDKQRSAAEIGNEFGVTAQAVIFFLKKYKIERRDMSEARDVKYWAATGSKNPMFGRKGKFSPNWKGGSTPERQLFYSSIEWRNVVKIVYKRDKYCCQRCGISANQAKKNGIGMDIHHIISFTVIEFRSDISNLILLCKTCHLWVHSNENTNREFIKNDPHSR